MLVELLVALVHLVLARALAVELVREVAEGLLGVEQAAPVVDVLQLHVRLVRLLLAELRQRAGVALSATRLVVVVEFLLDGVGLCVELAVLGRRGAVLLFSLDVAFLDGET
uniref:Putative secreted protein n=1 Tax=Ixodes ricinus TaxID=34613 RepID=A0A6B0UJC6_IXORI